jgi:molecular chaperone HscB
VARADGDGAALRDIAERARGQLAGVEAECGRLFERQDWFSEAVPDIARRLSRARYYDNLIADAERGGGAR